MPVNATILYWEGGSGTWNNTNSKWEYDIFGGRLLTDWDAGDTATFETTGGTITLGANIGAQEIRFTTSNTHNITGSNSYTLTLSGSNGIVNVTAGSHTISAKIGGTNGLSKNGSGTLTLSGANTFTGATRVNAGTLRAGANEVLSDNHGLIMSAGTEFNLQGYSETVGALNGDGELRLAGGTLTAGNNNNNTTFAGTLFGGSTSELVKIGNGKLTLSGSSTTSGTLTISSGTVAFGHATNTWDNDGDLNINGGTLSLGSNSDTVDNVALSSGSITGSGTLTADSYSFTGSGTVSANLAGTTGLTKSGSGTVTLSGNNTYTGATNINAGVLKLGANNVLSDSTDVTVTSGATFDVNGKSDQIGALTGAGSIDLRSGSLTFGDASDTALSGVIQGSGNLTKVGSGQFTLSGTNTYTGNTNINVGTLRLGANDVLSDSSNTSVASGATFDLNDFSDRVGGLSGAGDIDMGSGNLTAGDDVNREFSGVISGTGSFDKRGSGLLSLTGSNTYTGGTTVTSGVLGLGNGGTTGSIVGNVTNNATFRFNRSNDFDFDGVISGTGAVEQTGSGSVTFTATNTYTGGTSVNSGTLALGHSTNTMADSGSVTIAGGTLALGTNSDAVGTVSMSSGSITGSGTLTGSSYTFTDSGSIAVVLGGSGSLTKSGPGTVTLSNTNTYTDGTSVNGGILALGHATDTLSDSGSVTIAGGTLALGSNSDTVGAVSLSSGAITGSGTLSGSSYALTNSGLVSAALGGTGALTKSGTGTVTLSGANTYSGGTSISAGTLSGTTISIQGNISNNAAVVFDQSVDGSFAGVNSGSGVVTKSGTGNVTFSNPNTYTGGTTINAGTLTLGHATDTLADVGAVAINGGTLALGSNSDTVGAVSMSSGSITGTGTLTGSSYNFTDTGSVAVVLGGSADLTKSGAGNVTLSGTNTYSGSTSINAGTLQHGASNVLSDATAVTIGASGTLDLDQYSDTIASLAGSGSVDLGTGSLTVGDGSDTSFSGVISNSSGSLVKQGAGNLNLSGTNTYTGGTTINAGTLTLRHATDTLADAGAVTIAGGTLAMGSNSDSVGAVSLSSGSITGSGALTGSSYTFTNSGSVSAGLGGSGSLTKSGAGTVTLSGSNSFSGGVNLNAGTLTVDHANALGSTGTIAMGGGTLRHTANNTVDYSGRFSTADNQAYNINTNGQNVTWAGNLTSSGGSLTKDGLGILTLSGNNTYSGNTQVNAGTLRLGSSTAFSPNTTMTIAEGARFDPNGQTVALGNLAGAGQFDFGGDGLSLSGSENTTFSGALTGAGGLTKSGSGILTLTGSSNFSGNTNHSGGTLALGGSSALGNGVLNLNGGALRGASGGGSIGNATHLNASTTIDGSNDLTLSGTVTLGGFNTLNVTNSGKTMFSGGIAESSPSILIKQGSGELELTGASTFTGGTFIQSGTVRINNNSGSAFGTGAITVASGATLSGAGSFSGALQLNGTYSPGNSPGTQNTGSQTWAGGSELIFEIDNATGAQGSNWDLLAIAGSLTINATAANPFTLNVDTLLNGTDTAGAMANFDPDTNYSWVFATTTTGISYGAGASIGASFTLDTTGFANSTNGTFSISQLGNNLALTYSVSAVPEPRTFATLLGLAAIGWTCTRRRPVRQSLGDDGAPKHPRAST